MIRILIADDHLIFSEALRKVLQMIADFEVVGICQNTHGTIHSIRSQKPHIVFIDANTKPVRAVDVIKKITKDSSVKVIALSAYSDPAYAKNSIRAGAMGYVTKDLPKDEIYKAVRQVANGNRYICNDCKNLFSGDMLNATNEKAIMPFPANKIRQSKKASGSFTKNIEMHLYNVLKKLKLKTLSDLIYNRQPQLRHIHSLKANNSTVTP